MARFSPVTLGRHLKTVESGGFVLTETAHKPISSLKPHAHELASITFVLKGSCVETVGRCPYECDPFSTVIKPAGEVHSNIYGSAGALCLIIEVRPERLPAIRSFSKALDSAGHLRGSQLTSLAIRTYREFGIGDGASFLAIEGLVLEILGQATRHNSSAGRHAPPRWLREAKDFIHANFAQQVSLSGVAEAAGIHPAHLARVFRQHLGSTVGDYVRRLRLEHAARKLTQPDGTLADVAAAAGFYDQSHFTHAFKLHTGMTPAEYRATTRKRKAVTKKL